MSEDILNISVVNFYSIWGDPEQNLKRMVGYVKSAARTGAQIVVFPEMALTGYDIDETKEKGVPMQVQKAQTLSDMAGNAMSRIAHELDMYIFWGMPEKDKANPEQAYNVTAVAKPDGEVLSYRKIHLNPDEKSWAIPGNSPFLLETPWGLIGVAMCWEFYTHT
jgi:predicted amidohydrolase